MARSQQQAVQDSLEDKLGSAGKFISAISVGAGVTSWKIRAQLDVPKKLDIKYTQDIQIYPAQTNQQGGVI